MHENREDYGRIVRLQVKALEMRLGRTIAHGDSGFCPKCGVPGAFDIEGLGFNSLIDNAIYYSTVFNEWRCRICDFKMCS